MKKIICILLAATTVATCAAGAACSKGQTGGGNNALQGYTLTQEIENNDKDCKDGNCPHERCPHCRDGHSQRYAENDNPNSKDGGKRLGAPHRPLGEDEGGTNGFEFDDKFGMPRKRGGLHIIPPRGGVYNPDEDEKEDAPSKESDNENGNMETDVKEDKRDTDTTENKDGTKHKDRHRHRHGRHIKKPPEVAENN